MATNNGDSVDELAAAVRSRDRAALPRAITLVESTRPDHREQAQQLLLALMPDAGTGHHVGITGVPGVGKSTTIEALGMDLIEQGHRVAVLAVDPSSTRTGGSILGDKTRMPQLAAHADAYIRPSPTSGTLGGVAKATRETIVLLEAAGFDVILVETVGVGQSEVAVANMVDTFVFLTSGAHRRSAAGHQEGRAGAGRYRRGEQSRRRAPGRGALSRTRAFRSDPVDLSARNSLASTGSHHERLGRHRTGGAVGDRRAASRKCLARRGNSRHGGAPNRSTGLGRWCGTPCWTGCCRILRCAKSAQR